MRRDVPVTQLQQLPVKVVHRLLRRVASVPGLRRFEGLRRIRVGDLFAFDRIFEGAECGEFAASTFAHQSGQFAVVTGEKQERLLGGELVAHEHQRNHRRQQQQRGGGFQCLGLRQLMQSFAKGAIADLVVVLQKQHKRARRQVAAGLAARRAVAGDVALEHEALAEAARQLFGRVLRIVGVIGVGFAGQ